MAGSINRSATLPDSANKSDFYALLDSATLQNIANADVASDAGIVDTKLATISTAGKVSGAALTSFANIPSGAGYIPAANLASIPNTALLPLTTASLVDGATFKNLASIPSAGGIIPHANIITTGFTDYSATSTVTGWSSTTTKKIFYKKFGNTVFVWFIITGTSDSTSTNFTLPVATPAAWFPSTNVNFPIAAIDNGTLFATGVAVLGPSSSQLDFYKDINATTWTASGTKTIQGFFIYESA